MTGILRELIAERRRSKAEICGPQRARRSRQGFQKRFEL